MFGVREGGRGRDRILGTNPLSARCSDEGMEEEVDCTIAKLIPLTG